MTKDSVTETNLALPEVEQFKKQFSDFPEVTINEKDNKIHIKLSTDKIDYLKNKESCDSKKLKEISTKIANHYNCQHEGSTIGVKDIKTLKGLSIVISLSKKTDQSAPPSTSATNILSK